MCNLPVIRDLLYAQRIMGSPVDERVAEEKCAAESCLFVKNSDSRQRIRHFRREFERRGAV